VYENLSVASAFIISIFYKTNKMVEGLTKDERRGCRSILTYAQLDFFQISRGLPHYWNVGMRFEEKLP